MTDDITPRIPPALELVLAEARRERSPGEDVAWRDYILGRITFGQCLEALREARSR
jgi:hypothetical protein